MKSIYSGYLLFTIILILMTLLVGSLFYLSEVVVVCISTLCVVKYLKKLSLLVLGAIVILVTVIFPLLVLIQISKGSNLSLMNYLMPTNIDNLKSLLNFLLPIMAFIITAKVLRNRIIRTESLGSVD